jgi:hypothetical protein
MNEFEKTNGDIEAEKIRTQLKKEQFIKQIKSGLGEHIKHNGGKVKKVKKSFLRRFWERLINVF